MIVSISGKYGDDILVLYKAYTSFCSKNVSETRTCWLFSNSFAEYAFIQDPFPDNKQGPFGNLLVPAHSTVVKKHPISIFYSNDYLHVISSLPGYFPTK